MDLDTRTLPSTRLAAILHTGPYNQIGPAFRKLGGLAGPAGLFQHPGARMVGVYKDDPTITPADQLRSAAGVVIAEGVAVPQGLVEERTEGGRFACAVHKGSYERLPDAWRKLTTELIPGSGLKRRAAPSYERYLNDPTNTAEAELLTEICIPIQ